MQLFIEPPDIINAIGTCKDCEHRQRWNFNDKIFQYCGVRKSGRTQNGLLKIKCKDPACKHFLKYENNES